jgi:alanine racemase
VTSRYTIDLGALAANYAMVAAAAAPAACGAVVKADGYGLGAQAVVRRLLAAGCGEFFVATVTEAEQLRQWFADAAIYVFAGPMPETAGRLEAANAIPVVNDPVQLAAWGRRAAPVAVHVDTGMHRLGFDAAALAATDWRGVEVVLLLSHLACADDPDHPLNAVQLQRFAQARKQFPGVRGSIANSAVALSAAPGVDDLCRPGIALYGGNPFVDRPNPGRPVVRFEAQVLQLREVEHDEPVGYGATYRARGRRLLAVVGAGYADGIPRLLSNLGVAAVAGARVPFVGRVSMDLITLDVSEVAGAVAVGDWVELIGAAVPLDEVAALARTISYEVLTGLGRRSERIFLS